MKRTSLLIALSLVALLAIGLAAGAKWLLPGSPQDSEASLDFQDVPAKAREFIDYYAAIKLSPEQEEVRKAALSDMPAPCCKNFSAYTCCCECNLSRTVWGLSKHLIAKQGKDAKQVRAAVEKWIDAINPKGFSGEVCTQRGGCNRAFRDDGCGGMQADRFIY